MNIYELWENSDSTELLFVPEGSVSVDVTLFKKVWTCEAKSWEEANQKYHIHIGWDPYIPLT